MIIPISDKTSAIDKVPASRHLIGDLASPHKVSLFENDVIDACECIHAHVFEFMMLIIYYGFSLPHFYMTNTVMERYDFMTDFYFLPCMRAKEAGGVAVSHAVGMLLLFLSLIVTLEVDEEVLSNFMHMNTK